MECPYCGAEIKETARFCEFCGKNIEDARGDNSEVKIARMKHEEEMEKLRQKALEDEYERRPMDENVRKQNLKILAIECLAIIALMFVIVITKKYLG